MRKNLLLWLSIAALAAALGAVFWLLREDPFTPRRRLADGSTLYLEAVTYGSRHEILTGGGWRRLAPLMSPALQARLGVALHSTSAGSGRELCFWVRRAGPHGLNLRYVRTETFDELGNRAFRFAHTGFMYHTDTLSTPFRFPVWPRRGQRVGLRLYYRENMRWQPLAEFVVDNPARATAPPAAAPAPPVVVNASDLRVVLDRCVVRDVRRDPASGVSDGGRLHAEFRITGPSGRPAPWRPVRLSAVDAGGNSYLTFGHPAGRGEVSSFRSFMGGILRPPEPLRLRLQLGRRTDSPFLPEERWSMGAVPLPEGAGRSADGRFGHAAGGTIHFLGLRQSLDLAGWRSLRVQAAFSGPPDRLLGLIAARDDRGREYELPARLLRPGEQGLTLRVRADARRLRLTFAVQRSRTVELTVRPEYAVEIPF